MSKYLVVTASGEDRPGLVKTLSESFKAAGANIDESRMALLGGEFAMILLVSGEADAIDELKQKLPQMGEDIGLTISARETTAPNGAAPTMPYQVSAVAMDQPGIVHGITEFFSSRGINIRELSTDTYAAAHSGTPMFALDMVVDIGVGTKVSALRHEFIDYCDEHLIDASLEPGTG